MPQSLRMGAFQLGPRRTLGAVPAQPAQRAAGGSPRREPWGPAAPKAQPPQGAAEATGPRGPNGLNGHLDCGDFNRRFGLPRSGTHPAGKVQAEAPALRERKAVTSSPHSEGLWSVEGLFLEQRSELCQHLVD